MNNLKVVGEEKKQSVIEQAAEIIEYLNAKTGKKFRARSPRGDPTSMAQFVIHRLQEGYTPADCKAVVGAKCREWGADEKMSKYLTPETLFRRSNFERYLGALDE